MSKFLKLTSLSGKEVYVSDISSIEVGEYGATEVFTSNGRLYLVSENPSEVISELEKLKPSEAKTLRDEFAMAALTGLLSNSGGVVQKSPMSGTGYVNGDNETVSAWAFGLADAMLKERSK